MSSMNKVILIGNLTRDPETRSLPSGSNIVNCGLAVSRKYKSNNEYQEETTFVDFEAFGYSANYAAKYLTKGSKVAIEGRLKLDTWQDRNSGQNRSKLKVIAENIQGLDPRQSNQQSQQQTQYQQPAPQAPPPAPFPPQNQQPQQQPSLGDDAIDDIPF